LAAVSLFHPLFSRGSWWRLTLAQPLREPLLLETTFNLLGEGPPADSANRLSLFGATVWDSLALAAAAGETGPEGLQGEGWEVPLVGVVSAQPMEGEVQLYLAGAGVVRIEPYGLVEIATPSAAGVATPWGTFRYSRLPVSLVLHGRIVAPDRPMAAWVER